MAKRARAVIGAAFGDEGKGMFTDYLVRQGDPSDTLVVRFNGGAQAGHTVVAPDGRRHVFHHYGSGALAGARTYLSRHFLVNPVLWAAEVPALEELGASPYLIVDPHAPVTTPWDMAAGQSKSQLTGHGTCGAGVHETMLREQDWDLRLTFADLSDGQFTYERCQRIMQSKHDRIGPEMRSREVADRFAQQCRDLWAVAVAIAPTEYAEDRSEDIIFEGAQGLMLDQDSVYFPNVTHSRTGLANVRRLVPEMGVTEVDAYYVCRSYLTRHGAGPLPGESRDLAYPDDTNVENEWQGRLRFAPMDWGLVHNAVTYDFARHGEQMPATCRARMVVTHMDQLAADIPSSWLVSHTAWGPTSADVHDHTRDA